eukprot:TRINITY_DN24062_c0_g1_i1.p1 TRINITY_DN24062_c0_g1~~TRINITY_DN24062_c0_g1_i1.p1  ORF type:complete len:349 (+),score=77.64 TRINITY_DN24062_c0_g1_i1:120-1166(+)
MAHQPSTLADLECMDLANEHMHNYFERVGYKWDPDAQPTIDMLFELHKLHMVAIPFENLSVFTTDGVDVTLEVIANKFTQPGSHRGGYCFEQNRFFAAVLLKLGFAVELKDGRVWMDDGENLRKSYKPLRNHITMIVEAEEQRFLCDVGFARMCPCEPVPLEADCEVENGWCTVQLICDEQQTTFSQQEMWYLWYLDPIDDSWKRAFSFDMNSESAWVDVEPANMCVHSHYDSVFTQFLWMESAQPDEHIQLFGNELRRSTYAREDDAWLTRRVSQVSSAAELRNICQQLFQVPLTTELASALYELNKAPNEQKWNMLLAMRERQRAARRSLPSIIADTWTSFIKAWS